MNKMPWFLIPCLLALPACTSALKKRCESTNWFEHGEGLAKRGQRPATDSFVMSCEKEEASVDHSSLSKGFQKGLDEYCTPDFAHRLGKQGEYLTTDFCASGTEGRLRSRHQEGVREYCQASNGEDAGIQGKKYNQICPKDLEKAFLPEFKKGRRKYLEGQLAQKRGQASDMDNEILALERHQQDVRRELERQDWERSRLQRLAPTGNTANAVDNSLAKELQRIERESQSTRWQLQETTRKANEARDKQRELKQQIREIEGELPTL